MVDGNIEETLYLVGMQVHRDDAVDASHTQQVGYEFGTYRHAGLVLAVLARPAEIRDDGVDGTCRSTLCRIDHQQQLHQVVAVGKRTLDEEDVASADRLFVADSELAVRELGDLQLS